MNWYSKIISILVAIVLIGALYFGIQWQSGRSIDGAYDRAFESAQQQFDAKIAENDRRYAEALREFEDEQATKNDAALARLNELDRRQRASTQALEARLRDIPEQPVGDAMFAVLQESQGRWPE